MGGIIDVGLCPFYSQVKFKWLAVAGKVIVINKHTSTAATMFHYQLQHFYDRFNANTLGLLEQSIHIEWLTLVRATNYIIVIIMTLKPGTASAPVTECSPSSGQ